jgi:predicted dehydrogenase
MPQHSKVALLTESDGPHLDIYIDCLAAAPGVSEVSVADSSGSVFERVRSKLSRKFRDVPTYRDTQALLRERAPDLAIIAYSADHAPKVVESALDSGAHVLAEKPSCVRAAEFARLNTRALEKKRHLMLAFATRMNPLVIKGRELVQQGALGKLYGASLFFIADQARLRSPKYHGSWYASKERAGGGHLIWLGIHYVDAAQFITGQNVARVGGFAENVGGQPIQVEDSASVVMEFDGGMLATLQSGYYLDRNYHSLIRIWGAEGWLSMDLISGAPMEWHLNRAAGIEKMAPPAGGSGESYSKFVQAAIDAARGAAPPPVTGTECLKALEAVFALYQASSTGRTQRIA